MRINPPIVAFRSAKGRSFAERKTTLISRTGLSDRGVIPIDNVLIDHDGQQIADVGWFWDHAEQRHKIAQDVLIVNYVCSSGKHYPLEFRRFQKREQCEACGEPFQNHTELAIIKVSGTLNGPFAAVSDPVWLDEGRPRGLSCSSPSNVPAR